MHRRARAVTLGLVVAVMVMTVETSSGSARPESVESVEAAGRGSLVLVGGAMGERRDVLDSIVRLADPDGPTGSRRPDIAVITASSYPAQTAEEAADPDEENATTNGRYYVDLLERFGADAWPVPIDEADNYPGDPYVPANAYDQAIADRVRGSTGVLLGGGDQMRYVRTLLQCVEAEHEAVTDCVDTPVLAALRDVLAAGGVVAGTSAGLTIQQGPSMITGGQPYEAWRDGARPGWYESRRLAYVPYGGFGLLPGVLLDSHFTTWGRQVRAARLGLDPRVDQAHVIGVDEGTALVVDLATMRGRVVGRQGVTTLDLGRATLEETSARGIRWSYLRKGDRLDLRSWSVRAGRGATPLEGAGEPPDRVWDVWDSVDGPRVYSLRDLAVALVSSAGHRAHGVTREQDPRFRTVARADELTTAWTTRRGAVGFGSLELRVTPQRGSDAGGWTPSS